MGLMSEEFKKRLQQRSRSFGPRAPASACLEMLENAVIGAAASVHALEETKSTRATMPYSTNTLKKIKKKNRRCSMRRDCLVPHLPLYCGGGIGAMPLFCCRKPSAKR